MKKILSLLALSSISLLTINGAETKVYPGYAFNGISPDGSLGLSYAYGIAYVVNLETGKSFFYDLEFHPGSGNYMSENGIIVGFDNEGNNLNTYWKDGELNVIASGAERAWSFLNGITKDGSRIVGSVSPENFIGYDGMMLEPCYWDVQPDGTFGEIHVLPHPEVDLAGRAPQYINAVRVSDDGKTIAGQMLDFSGAITQLIVFTQNENGEWNYTMPLEEHFNLAALGITLPEWPGEFPDGTAYMTEIEKANYYKAYQEWEEKYADQLLPNYNDMPTEQSFMTEAEIQKMYDDFEAWKPKYQAYEQEFKKVEEQCPSFEYNNVLLSEDGSTYYSIESIPRYIETTREYVRDVYPTKINLETGEVVTFPQNGITPWLTALASDGSLLAQVTLNGVDYAYIMPAGSTEFIRLEDYFDTTNPLAAEWMRANMFREVVGAEWDEDNQQYVYNDYMAVMSGTPFCTPDMSIFAFTVKTEAWADDLGYISFGYILNTDPAGVEAIELGSPINLKVLPGGAVSFIGDVKEFTIYNLTGSAVFNVKSPSGTVETGLQPGFYVVKCTGSDNNIVTKKVKL